MKRDGWTLVHSKNLVEIKVGETIIDFRGEKCRVTGGRPPHRDGSTGRIELDGQEFFPSVVDAEWRRQ